MEQKVLPVKILVIGDICIDETLTGEITRMSEEVPTAPIVHLTKFSHSAPGMAANVALGIQALGRPVHIVSAVGPDVSGKWLKTAFTEAGISSDITDCLHAHTTVKTRIIANGVQALRFDVEKVQDLGHLINTSPELLVKLMVLSDYGKGVLSQSAELISRANSVGVRVLVDPKGKNWQKYRGAYLIKPNFKEMCEYLGKNLTYEETLQLVPAVREDLNIQNILMTQGANGSYLFNSFGVTHYPAEKVEVVDVCGAGDSFLAGLAVKLDEGSSLDEAIKFATMIAGMAVQCSGTVIVMPKAKLENDVFEIDRSG